MNQIVWIVKVKGGFAPYDVICKGTDDLISYLAALKKQYPYFKLIWIKQGR